MQPELALHKKDPTGGWGNLLRHPPHSPHIAGRLSQGHADGSVRSNPERFAGSDRVPWCHYMPQLSVDRLRLQAVVCHRRPPPQPGLCCAINFAIEHNCASHLTETLWSQLHSTTDA